MGESRDRSGRITRYLYDAQRRLLSTRDPLGRTTTQQWCGCGSLDALIDAKGQKTSWQRDVQGRVTREVRSDGVTKNRVAYEATTSRLKTVTDPKLQVTTYSYHLDDTRQSIIFTNAVIATPSVSFTYDPTYSRQAAMMDGTGTTSYTYHPVGVLGAGRLASVDGPLTNDTTTYAYDELSRVITRAVNGDANGNLTSDGTRAFEWDARNQLVAVAVGTHRSEFSYDGRQRRVRIVEKESGVTQSDAKVVWCENEICEERAADGTTLTRRDFSLGEQIGGAERFFAPDHLRTVGEVTGGANALFRLC